MTEPTTTQSSAFDSFGSEGVLGMMGAAAVFLLAMLAGKKDDEKLRAHERERAAREELDLFKEMRYVQRLEEQHVAQMRSFDAALQSQRDVQQAALAEKLASEARRGCARAEGDYWLRRDVKSSSRSATDALDMARAMMAEYKVEPDSPLAKFADALAERVEG